MEALTVLTIVFAALLVLALAVVLITLLWLLSRTSRALGEAKAALARTAASTSVLPDALSNLQALAEPDPRITHEAPMSPSLVV